MKRNAVGLAHIANLDNLARAFHLAARGRRDRAEVAAFGERLDVELATLAAELAGGGYRPGRARPFWIRDPKPRLIHAPAFRDRVAHHAIMACVQPVLDRTLIDQTFAGRRGRGALAAVRWAASRTAAYPWYCQIDIRAYFASIDHARLSQMLRRHFRDGALLMMLDRIIGGLVEARRGLPIGTLPSQCFANFYLSTADRIATEACRASGYARYMDDIVWWGESREAVVSTLAVVTGHISNGLKLDIKGTPRIGPSDQGLTFCGYRVLPGRLRLTARRRRRYRMLRAETEAACLRGEIDDAQMQRVYDSILATTLHANARAWRRAELGTAPVAVGGYDD